MSADNLATTTASLRSPALPILSGLVGTMGIANGLYSFNAPVGSATTFGILVPSSVGASRELQTWQKSQTRVHGIRNLAGGMSILGIIAFWRFSSICQSSPVAAQAAKNCLGIILLTGSIIGAGDGLIIDQFVKGQDTSEEAKEVGNKASRGHLWMSVPILALGLSLVLT